MPKFNAGGHQSSPNPCGSRQWDEDRGIEDKDRGNEDKGRGSKNEDRG